MFKNKTASGYEIQIAPMFKKYEVIEYIGCGSFSVVYKVLDRSFNKEYSAKIISMNDMKNQEFADSVFDEISILQKIDHPNVIKYIESFSIQNEKNEEFFVIVTEFCSNGNIHDYLNMVGYFNKEDIEVIIKGLAEAIRYLHSIGIAHCDIKLNNILLDDNYMPKLCDFNLSKDLSITKDVTCGGTFPYSAPEISEEGPIDFFKADIWSFAITIYAIAEADFPFSKDENGRLITDCLSIETENEELKELIEKCTRKKPLDRIDANQVLQERYFATINDDYYYYDYDNVDDDSYYNDVDDYMYENNKIRNFSQKKNKQAYNHKNHNYY